MSVMHYDVTSCVICISNNVEYLEKGVTEENILPKRLHCHFKRSLQCNKKSSTKFRCIGTLKSIYDSCYSCKKRR